MSDMTLIIDRRDTRLSLDGKALRIDQPAKPFQRIPLGLLGQVVIHGNAQAGCEVWRALAERNIPVLLLATRGDQTCWLGAGLTPSLAARRRQHLASPAQRLLLARRIVGGKIAGYLRLTAALAENHHQHFADLGRNVQGLPDLATRLRQSLARLEHADQIDTLMGVEGAAANAWFDHLAEHMPPHWAFNGRNRRPPRDPVNALLSLTYTLVASELRRAVHAHGLDPALGFLHQPYPGRESMVLDLLEPLRASADAFALQCLERLTPDHFHTDPQQGCRLSKEGRAGYYAQWASARLAWPRELAPFFVGDRFNDPGDESDDADGHSTLYGLAHRLVLDFNHLVQTTIDKQEPNDG